MKDASQRTPIYQPEKKRDKETPFKRKTIHQDLYWWKKGGFAEKHRRGGGKGKKNRGEGLKT